MQAAALSQFGCLTVAVLVGLPGCSKGAPSQPGPPTAASGKSGTLPIGLPDLDGNSFELGTPGDAKATVVVFTRSDCPISNRCAPEIRRLYEVYHAKGAEFFLVYVDPREQPDAIRRHLEEYQYPCRALRDTEHALVAYCEASRTPEAVVFDQAWTMTYRGRINDQYVDVGQPRAESSKHELADAIESTILGQPVAVPRTKAIGCPIADLRD